ncbi:glycosyltransferase [Spirulina sp. CS-785/01]|uniref:glycosyltransferase n=1 Tax=Spirulina sp. CS-785/01 TaxID=3021716 RepID=UPI00232D669D|nr:glycosyltransferase [Spirulina sp. CS-785/01]MDB9315916.1 glycosyltransferase [Spirulina sp. CS-785/01]
MPNSNSNILFFSGRLLPASETFVKAQGEQLRKYTPYYVGSRLVSGLTLPSEQTRVVNSGGIWGKAQEAAFKLWGVAPSFYNNLKALKPCLIHAHFGVCGGLALPVQKQLRVPLITTFYGLDATMTDEYAKKHSLSTNVYLQRREHLKQNANLFIAVSEFIKDKLLAQGFPEDKVIAHYYGVDTQQFQADPTIPREPIVLFVGRFTEKKGCEYLIKAMAQVQEQENEAELVLVGDGKLKAELESLAAQCLRRYQFLGFQPSSVVKHWMNRAKILAVPSVTAANGDSEGLPTVIVEAQAMGLPVVGSIHAGIPQAVSHEETGFLAEERDWQSLAQYIVTLLKNDEIWGNFSQNGKQRMREHFDLQKQTQKLEQIYDSVLLKE